MGKLKLRKLNNQGSTFVMAIIVISLVTILAVAILVASTHNLAIKNVDKKSKATFYTAESLIDEVRAGTGLSAMEHLGNAYETVLTTLVNTDPVGFEYVIDNGEANKRFKTFFIESLLKTITNGNLAFGDKEECISSDEGVREFVKEYLKNYIKGYDGDKVAVIKSVGNIEAYKDSKTGRSYMIIIRDVAMQYKEKKNGETFFSNITVDLEIGYPNMTIDFMAVNRLKDFTKYVFIADDNIDITGYSVTSHGSIYAGGIIKIMSNDNRASLAIQGGTENINVVCGGNSDTTSGTISLTGSGKYAASFSAKKADIWCTNIKIYSLLSSGSDSSIGGAIEVGSDCNTYVKDDLTINGQDSNVTIGGTYVGYSYDGASTAGHHANSSAMIVNGSRAKLTINTKKLLLAGHSFIDYTDNNTKDYMTGEALSFRGAQEVYLIPSEYLKTSDGMTISNPMPSTYKDTNGNTVKREVGTNVFVNIPSDFFAKKNGYLSNDKYETRTENGLLYVYFKFKDSKSAANYISDIANGANESLKKVLNKYTANLFTLGGTAGYVQINVEKDAKLYTNGTLLTTTNGKTTGTQAGAGSSFDKNNYIGASSHYMLPNDEFTLTSLDLSNRYSILTHLLADIPWMYEGKNYIVNDIDNALLQRRDYLVSGTETSAENIFDNIVDRNLLKKKQYNADTPQYIKYNETGKKYIKIAKDGSYDIPSDCEGGIVIATGDVTVKSDFVGMIIAGGNIVVNKGVTVTNNVMLVEELITTEYKFNDDSTPEELFKNYLYAYKDSATEDTTSERVKVEEVNYKDIVKVNNWRKYEDIK